VLYEVSRVVSVILWPYAEPSPESFQLGGFAFVRGGLTFKNRQKTLLIHSVSCFNLGRAWSFVWGG